MEVYRSGGGVMIWRRRCSSLCTATGVLCFRGEICTGTEREGEGEEGVSRNDGGKYEWERKVMERRSSLDFVRLLLPSPSSGLYQLIATYIVCRQ